MFASQNSVRHFLQRMNCFTTLFPLFGAFRTLTAAECDRTITPGKKSNDIKGVIETWAKETIIEIEESPEEDYDKIKDDQGYNKTDQGGKIWKIAWLTCM